MNKQEALAIVRNADGLGQVPEEQLVWLVDQSQIRFYPAGDFLFRRGEPADYMELVLSGSFRVYREQEKGQKEITELHPGDITGVLPYSRMVEATVFGQAREDSEVLLLPKERFNEMIKTRHALTQALVHLMTSRVREFTTLREQNEKMMALGKLSAGLAHELNNPAAAVVRSARELKRNMKLAPDRFKKVVLLKVTPEMVDEVNEVLFGILNREMPKMTLVRKAALEDELGDWMEDHGVEDAFELAPNYVDFGFCTDDLENILNIVGEEAVSVVLMWIDNNLVTEKLVGEIEEASRRISELVSSVKTYSHMDRVQERERGDIHEGIKSTLTLLNHRVKKHGIKLQLELDESLPHPNIFVSELNQLWTNLIDNALDAMENSEVKVLSIRSFRDHDRIKVEVGDTGTGIPDTIINKIYDPFFTTKAVGKGTGLGLEVSRRVVDHHGGKLDLRSEPGNTVFTVSLPFD